MFPLKPVKSCFAFKGIKFTFYPIQWQDLLDNRLIYKFFPRFFQLAAVRSKEEEAKDEDVTVYLILGTYMISRYYL
jgi:hypothetical protein